ncbi:MAG: hypothetical protein WDZ57_02745 [Demequina sp.]
MNPAHRIGLILAYAILGLAATGRSVVQIGTKFDQAPLPYALSGASAVLYVVIALALWRGWRMLAVVGTVVELVGVLVVGTLGFVSPELWPDATVWTGFGSGYGWVPLVLPVLALTLLIRARRGPASSPDSRIGT